MENAAEQNTQVNISSETPPIPLKKPFPIKKLLIPVVFLLILSAVLFLVLGRKTTSQSKQILKQPVGTQKILPKSNLLVYTRCFGGEKQPNKCNLYTSSLKDQHEQEIYSFDFPKVQQTDFEGGYFVNIHGIVNKIAIYTQSYWENKNKEHIRYTILGTIDLATSQNNVMYKQIEYPPKTGTSDVRDNAYISSVYLDSANNRVYYSTELTPGNGGELIQYDLSTKKNKTIADHKKLDDTYKVEYANSNKLYLSSSNNYITGEYYISKIFDLNTGFVTNTAKQWYNGVINRQGTKVAYIDETPVEPNWTYNLTLKVSDLDGKDIKEIYAISSTRIPGDGYDGSYPYSFVSNYFFDEFGDRLSFSVGKSKLKDNRYDEREIHNYVSFLEVRSTQPGQRGIILEAPANPNLYKTLAEVLPTEQEYQWVKFLTYEGPMQGSPVDGALYEAEGVWYLREILGYDQSKQINLLKNRKAILVNAENVFLIP